MPGANIGDTGEKLGGAGMTKAEGGGREIGPGWAGCVGARSCDA